MQFYPFYHVYTAIPKPKTCWSSKVVTLGKSILYPCTKSPLYYIDKMHVKHILGIIYSVIITWQVCNSELFTFLKIFEKMQIFGFSTITVKSSWEFVDMLSHANWWCFRMLIDVVSKVSYRTISFAPRIAAAVLNRMYKDFIVSDCKVFFY